MIERLTAAHFAGLEGETFLLRLEGDERLPLELVGVSEGPDDPRRPPAQRAPFAITFRGPAAPSLPQKTYVFEHPALGELEIFIVPIRPDAQGPLYEAVFG